jgi:hypothetical protein
MCAAFLKFDHHRRPARRLSGASLVAERQVVWASGPTTADYMKSQMCIAILLCITAGCRSTGSPADVPKAVFYPPGARELRVSDGVAPGQIDVAYVVEEKYPAPEIREGLTRTLRDSGYQPLDHDFLDPSLKLGVPRDWGSYVDGTARRETCVRELVEDWQNTQGDIARYRLRYDSPCEAGPVRRAEPTTATLKVTVGMIPAAAARAAREAPSRVSPGRL